MTPEERAVLEYVQTLAIIQSAHELLKQRILEETK